MREQGSAFSAKAFDRIVQLLASDAEFEERFCADAEKAIRERGISLSATELDMLRRARPSGQKGQDMETFDERLVLCSSSGY